MTGLHTTPNVQKAVVFFTQAGLSRLLAKVREKYIEVGQVGGQIILQESTPGERREIASFLGKPPYAHSSLKVKLVDLEKTLKHSFDCTLPELLSAFFPDQPLVTRQAKRSAHALHQADFRAMVLSIATTLPEGSRGRYWLEHGLHGQEWLFARYKNAPLEEQERQLEVVRYVASALDQLPKAGAPERLALFAQRTSGDPHALDAARAAGRLFLLALNDLENGRQVDSSPSSTPVQDRAQELRLYSGAGLLVDMISSNVAICNLAAAIYPDGTPDPLLQAAGQRVLLVPLRQLIEWKRLVPASEDVYVFENPQVFEEVAASAGVGQALSTLVCTSGWPSAAALMLLDKLLEDSPGNHLHYSGDFDLKGLQIATYLMARYPGRCQPWRFDPGSYEIAMQSGGVQASTSELEMLNALPDVFGPLVRMMQEKRKSAYQEGIVGLLLGDVNDPGTSKRQYISNKTMCQSNEAASEVSS